MAQTLTPQDLELIIQMFKANALQQPTPSTDVPANQGWLTVDSKDRNKGDGGFPQAITDFRINKVASSMQVGQIEKFQLTEVNFHWYIPNITPRNNVGQFWDTGGGVHTFTIAPGYYTLETFAPALEAALVGTGYGTFTVTVLTGTGGQRLEIENAFGTWAPIPNPIAGLSASVWSVAGVSRDAYTAQDAVAGFKYTLKYRGWYTRYIDIVSTDLTSYQRIISEGTHEPAGALLVRIHANSMHEFQKEADRGTGWIYSRPCLIQHIDMPSRFFDWRPDRSFGDGFGFRLLDEYGQPLYVEDPTNYPDFTLTFKTQSGKSLPI